MINPYRLKLCLKLGGECKNCREKDSDLWEVEHIHGNGYLEREWFKTNKIDMFEYYLDNFEEEKQYLQVYCKNCNYKKKIVNKENRNRIHFKDFEEFTIPFDQVNLDKLFKVLQENPILWQTFSHQIKMLVDITQKEMKRREENEIKFTKIDIDFPFIEEFKDYIDHATNEYTNRLITEEQETRLSNAYNNTPLFHNYKYSETSWGTLTYCDYILCPIGITPIQLIKKFGESKTKKYLKLMLKEGIIYESAAGKYKLL